MGMFPPDCIVLAEEFGSVVEDGIGDLGAGEGVVVYIVEHFQVLTLMFDV